MQYRVAVEDIEPAHFVAWVLDLPGCFGRGPTADTAIRDVPLQIQTYYQWVIQYDQQLVIGPMPTTITVVEHFQARPSSTDTEYIVNACFADDHRPLTYWDVVTALQLLRWTRATLLVLINNLTAKQLNQPQLNAG